MSIYGFDHSTLRAMQALTDHAEAMQKHLNLAEAARHYYDNSPTLQAMQALQTLGTSRFLEGLGPGKDESHDSMLGLPATGWADASIGATDPTAEMVEVLETLVELDTWIGLAVLLDRLREAGLDNLDAGWFAVARQIDECISWLMVTASLDGVCWNCGKPALTLSGVACPGCVVLLGEMVLEMWLLVEGL